MGLKANLQAFNNKSDLDDSNVTFYSETSSKGHKYEIGILLHKIYKELNDSETTYFKDYKFLNISLNVSKINSLSSTSKILIF